MNASIVVTPRTHWINGWFLRPFARPIVRLNGSDHEAQWGRPLHVGVTTGVHRVAVGARYRGSSTVLGLDEVEVQVLEDEQLELVAVNGALNHQPFVVSPI